MGVGRVLIGSDASPRLSDTLDAARTAVELQAQPGFEKPAATFGPNLIFSAPGDRGAALAKLPQVRAYAAPKPAYPRISRVHSAKSPTVVDGDADGGKAQVGFGMHEGVDQRFAQSLGLQCVARGVQALA